MRPARHGPDPSDRAGIPFADGIIINGPRDPRCRRGRFRPGAAGATAPGVNPMTRAALVRTLAPLLCLSCATPAAPPPESGQAPAKAKSALSEEDKAFVRDLLDAHNRERSAEKLPPLASDSALTTAAQSHAEDMAAHRKMTHDGSDGSTAPERLKRQGYKYQNMGENVAEGQRNVAGVMQTWMNSPPHRENILGKFTQAGIGLARDDEGNPYYCVDLGTPFPKLDPAAAASGLARGVNALRAASKRPPLRSSPRLGDAASRVARSLAAADSLDTTKNPDADLGRNLKAAGYRYLKVAVSAASGQPEPDDALATWKDSPDTRQTLLGDFTELGVGYAVGASGRPYWCLILARPAPG
jgi:uncharacterized protein YkwD